MGHIGLRGVLAKWHRYTVSVTDVTLLQTIEPHETLCRKEGGGEKREEGPYRRGANPKSL